MALHVRNTDVPEADWQLDIVSDAETMSTSWPTASERRSNNLQGSKAFYLKVKTRIWP